MFILPLTPISIILGAVIIAAVVAGIWGLRVLQEYQRLLPTFSCWVYFSAIAGIAMSIIFQIYFLSWAMELVQQL